MAEYIELPLEGDATALADVGKEFLADNIAGWEPRPGNVESVLLESTGQIAAEVVDQAAEVAPVAFAYFGQWLLGIRLREATPAAGTATFTFEEEAVTNVPTGSLFTAPNPDGDSYVFQTDDEVRSDDASLSVGATALEAGANANGSVGLGEMLDSIDGVATVTMTVAASNGADEEAADDYLDRLTSALTILAPRPILPQDHATMALQVPGVGRAVSIDLYQPSNAEGGYGQPRDGASHINVPRCVTTAITDEEGNAPTDALMRTVWTLLNESREVNFLEYVIPPTYTTIDVQATLVAFPGHLPSEVEAAAVEMMNQWLDPMMWGSELIGEVSSWARDTVVRLFEAVDFLNRAGGVHFVRDVQLRVSGGEWASDDIPVDGAAPLPRAGEIDITVERP